MQASKSCKHLHGARNIDKPCPNLVAPIRIDEQRAAYGDEIELSAFQHIDESLHMCAVDFGGVGIEEICVQADGTRNNGWYAGNSFCSSSKIHVRSSFGKFCLPEAARRAMEHVHAGGIELSPRRR
jgi:hypothetical protein